MSRRVPIPDAFKCSPVAFRVYPSDARLMTCTEDDIKVSEVDELLREAA